MLYRILFLLYTVYAQIDPITGLITNPNPELIYSRAYLRGMKQAADKEKELYILTQVSNAAKNTILTAATNGLLESSVPFPGCAQFIRENGHNIPIEMCKRIAQGVVAFITQRFPDSELTYNKEQKIYTLRWN